MAAVSDTSPLRYFIAIGRVNLLPLVVGPITVPKAVLEKLTHPSAPSSVRKWFDVRPGWFSVRAVEAYVDPRLSEILDRGECEAIQLALAVKPDFILLDERLGRREASLLGLNVIGALGILREANRLGFLPNPMVVLEELRLQGFRISKRLIHEFRLKIQG